MRPSIDADTGLPSGSPARRRLVCGLLMRIESSTLNPLPRCLIAERGAMRDCSGSSAIDPNLMSQPHIGHAGRQVGHKGLNSGSVRSGGGRSLWLDVPTWCRRTTGGIGGQQNAQRNLATVASDSNASTRAVTFDLVAPSGKTYIRARSAACQPRLSTSFKVRGAIPSTLSTDFPRLCSAEPSVRPRAPTPAHRRGSGCRGRRVPTRGWHRRRRCRGVAG